MEVGMAASSPLHIIHKTHEVRFDKAVRKSVSFSDKPIIVPPPEQTQEPPPSHHHHLESQNTDTIFESEGSHVHQGNGMNLYVASPLPVWDEKERRREYFSREYHYYPTPIREGIYSIATDANHLTTMFSEENPNACSISSRKRKGEQTILSNISSKVLVVVKMVMWKKGEMEDGAVWRKKILRGDKCRPLEFSGQILYDSEGNQMPKTPVRSRECGDAEVTGS
ncbi:hypothetical protein J5N97_027916 [Dioscorea zingiberensis]|uniref:Uncharacterized protein n=1 Tax=Dioscorea zingiberensis TaxID=325984 RepID=A0A9D5H4E8_9LILI|nr:hypothetical protein J5N97_027916 [Dioscorea zingiberensis]